MDRFTKRAKQVLISAQEEARHFNHSYVGTEHILLGLIRDQEGVAGYVLNALGVQLAEARSAVEAIVGRGEGTGGGDELQALTANAQKLLDDAPEEGSKLNHRYIGTEHLLLALALADQGAAARVLESMGINLDQIRPSVMRALREGPSPRIDRSNPSK